MAFLFASDLHLDASAPAPTRAFLRWLAAEAREAEALYLLGDLFESWIGDDDPDPHRDEICRALAQLNGSGVPVFAMHGNRDFLLGPGFEARSGCRLLPDPVLVELHGARVLLSHGDLFCTDDHAYQELRTMVRDPDWQARVLALPVAQRQWLADAARAGSRAHTAVQAEAIMDVNPPAVERALRLTRADWLIHGHTHRPGLHVVQVEGREARRAVLDAWYEQASVLSFAHGRVEAHSWRFEDA